MTPRTWLRSFALTGALALALPAAGHDGVVHSSPEEAAAHKAETGAGVGKPTPELPFPVEIKAKFDLINQDGQPVSEADYAGKPMAIFFGYANCEAICSVALPRLGAALDILGDDIDRLAPLMITVDPARDTVEAIGPALAKWHPKLRGLTGSEAALADAREAFQVETSVVGEDAEGQPIYAHGSFIYLLDGEGKVLTLMPPILGPERMAEILRGYL
ncbi:MAG: SCO family protein [Pseudomonadota bacterium]